MTSKSVLRRLEVQTGVKVGEEYDLRGPVRVMAIVDGYCMVCRPRCIPFVVALTEMACTSKAVASREPSP